MIEHAQASSSDCIDLNSDMGEGYGAYAMGDDDAMLEIVSSANVACGFHAGDPDVMARTFGLAKMRNVAVGAHPGYHDLAGFGRRAIPTSSRAIERLVAYQVGAAQALAAYSGHRLTHVKSHGALGNLTQTDAEVAAAVSRAVRSVDPSLVCLVIARGHQERIAREMGLQVRSEIFADRGYTEEGHLISRKLQGAVLHDVQEAAARVLRMVKASAIETASGRLLPTPIDSICVHSDTPSAVSMAREVKRVLEAAGIAVRPFA